MKRSSLTLSVFGVAVFGCLAFSSTASAVASGTWGPDPCAIDYDYCVAVSGNSEATVKRNTSNANSRATAFRKNTSRR